MDSDSYITHSCRLSDVEKNHLKEYWDNKFSDFVHSAFKTDISKVTTNKRQNRIQKFTTDVVMLGFGAIFILFSLNTSNLWGFLLVFGLGVFFMINSLITVFMGLKEKIKYGR